MQEEAKEKRTVRAHYVRYYLNGNERGNVGGGYIYAEFTFGRSHNFPDCLAENGRALLQNFSLFPRSLSIFTATFTWAAVIIRIGIVSYAELFISASRPYRRTVACPASYENTRPREVTFNVKNGSPGESRPLTMPAARPRPVPLHKEALLSNSSGEIAQ